MLEVIAEIFNASSTGYTIAVLMTLCASFMLRELLDNTLAVLGIAPVLLVSALSGIYVSNELGLGLTTDEAINATISSGCGMMVGLVVLIITLRIGMAAVGAMVKRRSAKLADRLAPG